MGLHCVSSGSIDPTIWTARSGRRAAPSDRRTQSWRSPGRGSRYARGAAAPSRRHPRSGRTAHRALCEGSTHTHGRRAARDGHVDWMMARGGGGRVGTDASTGGRDLRDRRPRPLGRVGGIQRGHRRTRTSARAAGVLVWLDGVPDLPLAHYLDGATHKEPDGWHRRALRHNQLAGADLAPCRPRALQNRREVARHDAIPHEPTLVQLMLPRRQGEGAALGGE